MSGHIYQITIGDYRYYGQTTNWSARSRQHLKALERGNHDNCIMQAVYNKYHEFEFTLLEATDDLDACEQQYLDLHIDDPKCMNIAPTASVPARVERPIKVKSPDGKVTKYPTIKEAADTLGVAVPTMHHWINSTKSQPGQGAYVRKQIKHLVGYVFAYEGEPWPALSKRVHGYSKQVVATLPNGATHQWPNALQASKELGVSHASICNWCRGSTPQPGTARLNKNHAHIHRWVFQYASSLCEQS